MKLWAASAQDITTARSYFRCDHSSRCRAEAVRPACPHAKQGGVAPSRCPTFLGCPAVVCHALRYSVGRAGSLPAVSPRQASSSGRRQRDTMTARLMAAGMVCMITGTSTSDASSVSSRCSWGASRGPPMPTAAAPSPS